MGKNLCQCGEEIEILQPIKIENDKFIKDHIKTTDTDKNIESKSTKNKKNINYIFIFLLYNLFWINPKYFSKIF